MRKALLMLLAMLPAVLGAQRDSTPSQVLPSDVRALVVKRWNGANAIRTFDPLDVEDRDVIQGNVAVARSPLTLGGHVTGNVLVVNADVILRPTAHIDGELTVVGGDVEGRNEARVDGATRIYRQPMPFREEGELIVATDDDTHPRAEDNWWTRIERRHDGSWTQALRVVQAGPYNRVEGLPIQLGPVLREETPWGSVRVDAAAIIRTASTFSSEEADVGHDLRTEVRTGHRGGLGIGARLFNVVDPVESWQLSDLETALSAFVSRRDYRDYFQRHGLNGFVTLYGAQDLSLTGSYGVERWSSRGRHEPFSLLKGDVAWRANPAVDEGLFHIANATLKFDSRSDPDEPWSGWLANANIEHGTGSLTSVAPESGPIATRAAVQSNQYTSAFFDVRRYNRLGPSAQLNMRVVLGGWLGGDELPLERRLSVDGPGTLPGFGFRAMRDGSNVSTCSSEPESAAIGTPAECDRIALAQIEYRGDVKLPFTGGLTWPRQYHGSHGDVVWVLFADAGRGWKVDSPDAPPQPGLTYGRGAIPSLSTFRSDVGIGIDVSGIGIYAAKALSTPAEPVRFFIRLRHRF
jgi:hypothetical protein